MNDNPNRAHAMTPARPRAASSTRTFDLTGRVALVTGASRGLGLAMATGLAAAGARIVLWARRRTSLAEAATAIRRLGSESFAQSVDVTDTPAVRHAVREAVKRFGAIDILVNNAGIWDGDPLLRLTPQRWSRVLATDLTAVFTVSQAVAAHMVRRRRGAIVHISSTSGILAHPDGSAYGSAKAAVIHLTRVMAVELGPSNIRVNSIAPGLFETDMTRDVFADRAWITKRRRQIPLRRFGRPDDLQGLIVFLASDAARHITGQTIVIDGGASLTVGR